MNNTVFIICSMVVPVVMVIAGAVYIAVVAKKKGSLLGYHSAMSSKNSDTWQFAHERIGRLWFGWGIILAVITAFLMFMLRAETAQSVCAATVGICFFQILIMVLPLRMVEKALRFTFNKYGERFSDSDAREI